MTASSSTPPQTGMISLEPLSPSSLPSHPLFGPLQASRTPPDLTAFISAVLTEAKTFMTSTFPAHFQKKGAPRPSAPASASVDLLAADFAPSSNPNAVTTWFARSSTHNNRAERGTATWHEFVSGLYDNHSAHEGEYTPEVYDAICVASWEAMLREDSEAARALRSQGWGDAALDVYEMAHKIPSPVNNRVFAIAVVRGKVVASGHGAEAAQAGAGDAGEFVTATIPVEISEVKEAMYSNGRHKRDGDTAMKRAKAIIGIYAAVERVAKDASANTISWDMATASDAKGWLPPSMQKMGVPAAIVKDVGYFIDWVDKMRAGKS